MSSGLQPRGFVSSSLFQKFAIVAARCPPAEKPLTFTAFDDTEYSVYYVAADKGSTTNVPVPLDDSNNERPNTISGNNVDGYIVCVNMTENAAPADSSSQTDQQAATE